MLIALRLACKLAPVEWLDTGLRTVLFEMLGGPGHLPPDMSLPPFITMVEYRLGVSISEYQRRPPIGMADVCTARPYVWPHPAALSPCVLDGVILAEAEPLRSCGGTNR